MHPPRLGILTISLLCFPASKAVGVRRYARPTELTWLEVESTNFPKVLATELCIDWSAGRLFAQPEQVEEEAKGSRSVSKQSQST